MPSRTLVVLVLCSWLAACTGLPPQVEATRQPALPTQFDPPLSGIATPDTVNWWAGMQDPRLDALIARALAANRDLRTATTRIAQARAVAAMAEARRIPQIGATGAGGVARLDRRTGSSAPWEPDSAGWDRGGLLGLDVSWELDLFGALARRRDASAADLEAAIAGSGAVAVMVAGEVAATYVDLRAAQAKQEVLRRLIEIARDVERLTAARKDAGMVPESDHIRATAQLQVTRAEMPRAEAQAEVAARRLGVLVGGDSQALLVELALPGSLPGTVPVLPAAVPAALLERRPDLIVAERQWQAALARSAGAEADRLPTVSLGAVVGLLSISGGNLLGLASGAWNLAAMAAMLRAPLYAPGLVAATQLERARAEEAAIAYEKAAVTAVLEVEEAMLRFSRSREREAELQRAVAADIDALGLALLRYERGLTDFLPVLDVMRSRSVVEQQWLDSRAETLVQYVALNKALGGGWQLATASP